VQQIAHESANGLGMYVQILGSAAGGGFPQWNCNCANCRAVRSGTFSGKARSQTQVAVSADAKGWALLNASPDLRTQIEATTRLHPRDAGRHSPIAGVVMTSADLDQIAGLLSLRELQPLRVYCTASLRRILHEDNSIFGMLNRVPEQVSWIDVDLNKEFPLEGSSLSGKPLSCTAFSLGSRYPVYVSSKRVSTLRPDEALAGLIVKSSAGATLAYLPAVPALDDPLIALLETVDLLLFDGTFWSDDELIRVQGKGATALEMGHIPISGVQGSLRRLAGLKRPRKVFLHVNNTNPILDASSEQYKEVRAAGWEVAEDGWQFEL
jgi:pyrroloquinoline quinone biosynthesis protein B